jgi:uncharacterized protein YbjQ (UPF0145 family)
MEYIPFLFLFAVGYVVGGIAERNHYSSIKERESKFLTLETNNCKRFSSSKAVKSAELVSGSAVISLDYFKRILASLRAVFGGNISSYETLVDRARREATLRLKEQASDADAIINLRVETSVIGGTANQRKTVGSIEALAYATAVWYER